MSESPQNNSFKNTYNHIAVHFDRTKMPRLLLKHLPSRQLSLMDFGCGDGPWFHILSQNGFIGEREPVYAIDEQKQRLDRIKQRFPLIHTIQTNGGAVSQVTDATIDFVISTMVLEHVENELEFLNEISRVLKKGGKAYITTVFKKKNARYFRRRNGEYVLDVSHLREYTDLKDIEKLCNNADSMNISELQLTPMWFPVLDPLLFRLAPQLQLSQNIIRWLRIPKIRIPRYFELELVLEKK